MDPVVVRRKKKMKYEKNRTPHNLRAISPVSVVYLFCVVWLRFDKNVLVYMHILAGKQQRKYHILGSVCWTPIVAKAQTRHISCKQTIHQTHCMFYLLARCVAVFFFIVFPHLLRWFFHPFQYTNRSSFIILFFRCNIILELPRVSFKSIWNRLSCECVLFVFVDFSLSLVPLNGHTCDKNVVSQMLRHFLLVLVLWIF